MKSICMPSLVCIHFPGTKWNQVGLNLAISAISVSNIYIENWQPIFIPLNSPIHPLFRVNGSGIIMSLSITSFTLYSSLIHLSLCSNSGFTDTLSHQAEKALAASDSWPPSEFLPLVKECFQIYSCPSFKIIQG